MIMKNKIKIILIGILSIALIISVSININSHLKEQERIENIKSLLYVALSNADSYLDACLYYYELGDNNQALMHFGSALTGMARADNVLRSVDKNSRKRYDNSRPSLLSMYVSIYERIMIDGVISESEIVFITRLKGDMDILFKQISNSPDYGYNKNLTLNEIENIILDFLKKWEDDAEDNPWLLLQ